MAKELNTTINQQNLNRDSLIIPFRRNCKLKQQYSFLSDALKDKISGDMANFFRIRGMDSNSSQTPAFRISTYNTNEGQRQRKSHRQSPQEKHTTQTSILPKLEITTNSDHSKKIKSQNPPETVSLSIGKARTSRYEMAPHLNLQKTIYLFKRDTLDTDCQNFLTNQERRQKSFQFQKPLEKKILRNFGFQHISQNERLKGFRTTLYEQPGKTRSKDRTVNNLSSKLQEMKRIREDQGNKRQIKIKAKIAEKQKKLAHKLKPVDRQFEFSPWHVGQKNTQY